MKSFPSSSLEPSMSTLAEILHTQGSIPISGPSSESLNMSNEPWGAFDGIDDNTLALFADIPSDGASLGIASKLIQAGAEARASGSGSDEDATDIIENLLQSQEQTIGPDHSDGSKDKGKGPQGIKSRYGYGDFSVPSSLSSGFETPDSLTPGNLVIENFDWEDFPMCLPSADPFVEKDKIFEVLATVDDSKDSRNIYFFGFKEDGNIYDYAIRTPVCGPEELDLASERGVIEDIKDAEIEKTLQREHPGENYRFYICYTCDHFSKKALKSIFRTHDLNPEFLQGLGWRAFPEPVIGYRALRCGEGNPESYDIYLSLPMRLCTSGIDITSVRKSVSRTSPRSVLDLWPLCDPDIGKEVMIIETPPFGISLKYDVRTRKTVVFVQWTVYPPVLIKLIREACQSPQNEQKRDPFFILVIALRNWLEFWNASADGIRHTTEWLDVNVQQFVTSEGNEIGYSDLNAKLHITQRYVSQMSVDVAKANSVFKIVREQHSAFLDFTGLRSKTSVRVREQLARLELNIESLARNLQLQMDKIKTSSAWLSTSISLKHAKAMRIASEESQKASLALKENTASIREIAEINRLDTLAMKENTDAMRECGTLMRELGQETLDSHKEIKKNGDTMRQIAEKSLESNKELKKNGDIMRQIAEESKKITEANRKESETMTQIAMSTQKDGQSMKVLAFLTMMYLPGAFVSSIFGWSIISFDVSDDGSQTLVVAKQWWLFAVSTVTLTVITILGCFIWIWMSQKKLTIGKAKVDRIVEDENSAKKTIP